MNGNFRKMPEGWMEKYLTAPETRTIAELRSMALMPTAHSDELIKMAIDDLSMRLVEIYVDPIYLFWSISNKEQKITVEENYEISGGYHNAVLNMMNPLPELLGKLLGNRKKGQQLRGGLKYIFREVDVVYNETGSKERFIENIKLFDDFVAFFRKYIRGSIAHSGFRDARFSLAVGANPQLIVLDGVDERGKDKYVINVTALAYMYLNAIFRYIFELKAAKDGKVIKDFLFWYSGGFEK